MTDQLDVQVHLATTAIGKHVAKLRVWAQNWEPRKCPRDWKPIETITGRRVR